jgi:hypothetical protein
MSSPGVQEAALLVEACCSAVAVEGGAARARCGREKWPVCIYGDGF